MTLVLIDGCEDLSSWQTASGVSVVAAGRYQNCIRFGQFVTGLRHRLLLPYESDTITIGFAVKFTGPMSAFQFVTLQSDNGGTEHMKVQPSAAGGLDLLRGFTTVATGTAGTVVTGVWYYLEFQSKLADAGGTAILKLDGATIHNFSGDTKNAGTKTVYDQIAIQASSTTFDIDDLYIKVGTDTFMGGITVETLYPNGNGDTNAWIGSDGNSVDNYLLVDETGTPNTADYTSTATVGAQDLYQLGNLVHTDGSIVGVCHSAHALRTDALTAINVKLLNRRGATNAGTALPLGTTYRSYEHGLTVDPETGVAFTIADVNALQSGVELA